MATPAAPTLRPHPAPEPRGRADAEPAREGGVFEVNRLAAVLAAAAFGALASAAHAQTPRFDLVGVAPGSDSSRVRAVTNDGRAGGGSGSARFGVIESTFLWSPESGRMDLTSEPELFSFVFSRDLSAYAGSFVDETSFGFHNRIGGNRTAISIPGRAEQFYGISPTGRAIAGAAGFNEFNDAILWTESDGLIQLPSLGGTSSIAFASTDDASLVVGEGLTAGDQALVGWAWNPQTGYRFLPNLIDGSTTSASARSITPDARVIGGWSAGFDADGNVAPIPTLWTDEGPLGLGTVPGFYGGVVTGMSDDASVVVGDLLFPNWTIRGSFVWTAETGIIHMQDYLAGLGIGSIPADVISMGWPVVSANGQVLGGQISFRDGQVRNEGFVAILPGPGTPLLLLALTPLAARRRR